MEGNLNEESAIIEDYQKRAEQFSNKSYDIERSISLSIVRGGQINFSVLSLMLDRIFKARREGFIDQSEYERKMETLNKVLDILAEEFPTVDLNSKRDQVNTMKV